MKFLKLLSVLVALVGVGLLVLLAAPSVHGPFDSPVLAQGTQRAESPERRARTFTMLAGRGAEIGVSIRDVESSDKSPSGGVVIEEVRKDGPADKAGLKQADVIVEFDGEHVRSARQFTRLVQETVPGRTVKATVVRDGQRNDVQLTPDDRGDGMSFLYDGNMRDYYFGNLDRGLGRLNDRMQNFNFDGFSFAFPQLDGRGRLGVSVEELTPQLATYFGAKDGVLIASVSEDSPASRAGLKAGDVITKVNNDPVGSREDLLRLLRDVKDGGDVTIGIVRDKKESSVTAKLESRRPARRGQPA
jgi:serine protease Do